MTIKSYVHDTPIALGIDTGASCNLLSANAFKALREQYNLPLCPSDISLTSVQGSTLSVLGTVTLPIRFEQHSSVLNLKFQVISEFALSCDGLIGLDSLCTHNIDVHPSMNAIFTEEALTTAMQQPVPLLTPVPHTTVNTVQEACSMTTPEQVVSEGSQSAVPSSCPLQAVVIGDQHIGPTTASRLSVRLKGATVGSCVLSLPDTVRVHRLALEGTLSTVSNSHTCDTLVTNLTGSPITLKDGTLLGNFEQHNDLSLEDAPQIVAGVSTQSENTMPLATASVDELASHVVAQDYPEVKPRLLDLLAKHRNAVALPGESLGVTHTAKHSIVLKEGTQPSYVPSYRLPYSQRAVVEGLMNDYLEQGVIQESYSPWNSPLFLVKKKSGSYRPVIDFRKVNSATVPDHYPLPVLSDLLQSIGSGNTVFTSLDLLSGFFQIPLDEKSREITAFSTHNGHYEWLRTPMGLRNSPLTFQRMVNHLFSGIIGNGLFVYMDDLIVVSRDVDSHFEKLSLVFERLSNAGLKLNLQKCKFFRSRIEFLGHVVDHNGIHTSDAKVSAVKNFPTPKTTENVRSFLGLAGYYRAFVKGFASIASPLTRLLKKDVSFHWHDVHQQSFDALKHALTHAPVLTFPDYQLPFIMCTDASGLGIGAVLMQQKEGHHPQVIAYASRVLTAAESKYSVTHLEALAVIWGLKHYRDIIYGYDITVHTDHSAVTSLFQTKNLTGRLARWFITLQQFNPTLKYLPGRANSAADALSRNVPVAAVQEIENFSLTELSTSQRNDPMWSTVIYALESGDDHVGPKLPVPFSQFFLRNGILCRKVTINNDTVSQLVIPSPLVETVLKLLHDTPQAGHPGRDRTLAAARQKFFWPKLRADVESHVAKCLSCAQTKGNTHTAPMLEYPVPDAPFDTVAIDLLQLPRSHQGSSYVLTCVDHFSRFTILVPLPNKSATTVAHAIVSHLICPFTTPRVILSDNGAEFSNEILANICKQYNITQTFVTAYHPASNGLVERTNKKILEVLRHFAGNFHESWEDWLPQVAASINGSVNSSTGKTPHYVIFGSDKRLPYDVLLQSPTPVYSVDDYAKQQIHAFQRVHQSVRENLVASREEMIHKQHAQAKLITIAVGDSVMKRCPDRQSKLSPKFSGPYTVISALRNNKFKIWDPNTHTSEYIHVDRLKKVHLPIPSQTDPV